MNENSLYIPLSKVSFTFQRKRNTEYKSTVLLPKAKYKTKQKPIPKPTSKMSKNEQKSVHKLHCSALVLYYFTFK